MKLQDILQSTPMRYWKPNQSGLDFIQKNEGMFIGSRKYDGALYRFSNVNEKLLLQSRTISAVTGELVEKQDNVPQIVEELNTIFPKNSIVLGEICYPYDRSLTSKDVTKVLGCKPKLAQERFKANPVSFVVFDILAYDGESYINKTYSERISKIESIDFSSAIHVLPTVFYHTNPISFIYKDIEQGYEGGVLYNKKGIYITDMKSAKARLTAKIKVEHGQEIDAVIMGTVPATKLYNGDNLEGWRYWENTKTQQLVELPTSHSKSGYQPVTKDHFVGRPSAISYGAYYGDNLLEIGTVAGLTEQFKNELKEGEHIGKVIKLNCMSVDTTAKTLRHPIFQGLHPDKNPEECLYEEIFN